MLVVAVGFAAVNIILSYLVGKRKIHSEKLSPYECGMPPIGSARIRFPIKFYLIGMLFIIFDIEAVFLYPWAAVLKSIKSYGAFVFYEMVVFIIILLLGLLYLWKRKALEWEKSSEEFGET
ncbi:MAG: NADH-quinone oxidoreductase subunit A [Candidatus Schekmanbacteria bacterium]|nr:MAG: NADH-quinone oxidoreductase subunit A [Candidatus Schekmanbacteria bacterium]